jgi:peptidyl-prolyl cis-trans isomerase B (cyclophilin B)
MSTSRQYAAMAFGVAAVFGLAVLAPDDEASARSAGLPGGLPGVCVYTPDLTGSEDARFVGLPPAIPPPGGPTAAVLETNLGSITVKLNRAAAPCTVNSFKFLVEKGFYDGTECHRMLDLQKAGVLQCGDPTAKGTGGPGYDFGDENLAGATYDRGVIAMANHGPDPNGSQFFLVFRKSAFGPNYTPFGVLESGVEVLDAAAKKGTYGPAKDKPYTKVVITKATLK